MLGAAAGSSQIPPDTILINGVIRTMDDKRPLAEAIAISDGRIVAVGTSRQIKALSSPGTTVIDARGRLVLPGFNDAHVHFIGVGNWFSHLDSKDISNTTELLEKVRHFTRHLPKGRWLIGARLDLAKWKGPMPTLERLDAVSPDNPIILYLSDPTSAVVNSAARSRARVAPEGLILSGPQVARIRSAIPADHGTNWAEIAETASNYAASFGVTSVQDVHSDNLLDTYRQMAKAGRLKTRIYECVGMPGWLLDNSIAPRAATGDDTVRGGCIKTFSDASVEEKPELVDRITRADKAGHQVLIHAIGRRANANVVAAFAAAIEKNGPRDRRFRIEHAHNIDGPEIARLRALGIIPSMQPALFYDGGDVGDDYPLLLRSGANVAFGSDASMIDIDPLMGLHASVNSGANSISVETAVRAYTLGSAYAEFQEKQKGSIMVGKLADLVILSRDIFSIPKHEIRNTKVETTILGGRIIYSTDRGAK